MIPATNVVLWINNMPRIDKEHIVKGVRLIGGDFPAMTKHHRPGHLRPTDQATRLLVSHKTAGETLWPKLKNVWLLAKKRLEEIVAAVRRK